MNRRKQTSDLVLTAAFLAILILLSSVPFLGFIPIGPLNATTLHIPVIIASIVLGPKRGAFLGFCFGIISMIRNTIMITPLSFVFSPFVAPLGQTGMGSWQAILVVLIPRILIGILPFFVYKGCLALFKKRAKGVQLFIAGLSGGLINTIVTMNLIYFLFQKEYASVIGESGRAIYAAILGVIFAQGVPESLVAGIATAAVAAVLLRLTKREI